MQHGCVDRVNFPSPIIDSHLLLEPPRLSASDGHKKSRVLWEVRGRYSKLFALLLAELIRARLARPLPPPEEAVRKGEFATIHTHGADSISWELAYPANSSQSIQNHGCSVKHFWMTVGCLVQPLCIGNAIFRFLILRRFVSTSGQRLSPLGGYCCGRFNRRARSGQTANNQKGLSRSYAFDKTDRDERHSGAAIATFYPTRPLCSPGPNSAPLLATCWGVGDEIANRKELFHVLGTFVRPFLDHLFAGAGAEFGAESYQES
jgi:hypothetical protein